MDTEEPDTMNGESRQQAIEPLNRFDRELTETKKELCKNNNFQGVDVTRIISSLFFETTAVHDAPRAITKTLRRRS